MRNGNSSSIGCFSNAPAKFLPYLWGMETFCVTKCIYHASVLTVPMRNGNTSLSSLRTTKLSSYRTYEEWKPNSTWYSLWGFFQFLPYLWGMETFCVTKCIYHASVLTVPMRNGNNRFSSNNISITLFVLTVPMRNGNVRYRFCFACVFIVLTVPMRNGNLVRCCVHLYPLFGSYRTYEEWKPLKKMHKSSATSVLTVPMRNGNLRAS